MFHKSTFSKNERFIGKMFDDISATYDSLNHLFTVGRDIKWRRDSIKYLKSSGIQFKAVADIGCGTGDFGKALTKLNPEYIASIDLSLNMLEINRIKLNLLNNYPIKSNVCSLPLKFNSIDLVTIGFGIRNFEDLERAIEEIHCVLNKDAYFTVIEMFKPDRSSLPQKIFVLYFKSIMAPIGNKISGSDYAYSYLFDSVNSFITVDEFIDMVTKKGFALTFKKNNFLKFIWTLVFRKL